jgi:Domain of unknown function (DUF4398)
MKTGFKAGTCRGASFAILALAASWCAGCASAPPPPTLLQARQSVQQAQQAPADQYSALELHEAQEKLNAADAAAAAKKNADAERLAQESLINVQVAKSKADAEHANQAVDELAKTVQTLQQETVRPAAGG